jgi:outer membrane protein assembly factor BamB
MKKFILIAACMTLTACETMDIFSSDDDNAPLQGDRLSLYDFERTLQQSEATQFGMPGAQDNTLIALPASLKGGPDENINLPKPWNNKFWPQNGGYPNHMMKHVAFTSDAPNQLWSSDIGRGGSNRMPLTASPIMADEKVFTINNDSEIFAFNHKTGQKLWKTDIVKKDEDDIVLGGGLAFSGGRLFATNGFNELLALNPDNGEILWRVNTKEPVRAAPSAIPSRVFVTTMSNRTLAFDTNNGQQLWSHRGLSSNSGVLGSAKPAISRDAVIAAYESGEIYALQIDTGTELWSENLSPLARTAGQTVLSDIQALPVIDNNIVYAASYNNRMSAINARTGQTIWSVPLGTSTTPWLSGNRLFVIESQGTMMSLDKTNGQVVWQSALPQFEDEDDREGQITWHGPYLAGGRLIALGSHGFIMSLNPSNGSVIDTYDYEDDIYLSPIIANGILYAVDEPGRLHAWQ